MLKRAWRYVISSEDGRSILKHVNFTVRSLLQKATDSELKYIWQTSMFVGFYVLVYLLSPCNRFVIIVYRWTVYLKTFAFLQQTKLLTTFINKSHRELHCIWFCRCFNKLFVIVSDLVYNRIWDLSKSLNNIEEHERFGVTDLFAQYYSKQTISAFLSNYLTTHTCARAHTRTRMHTDCCIRI